ncbi:DNA recombination/repair protein RecN [Syntrophomonas zehnderi OL-4]|uniref:DNA repair protein RecN n=1 Tax=Syntrophomonas zehnderi OL-4 TaxID=690567 RepID=A0A0E3W351_9FIRM|nr:DNA repair protein RecN [Syntrophomonas zehnderi]CFX50196.1 DNA recombination/repair protein RecN [Syntrophomonas zehnderi OL-4]
MLEEIYIKNFILIEEQRLYFTAGLNVLTGETGAGKSIIIDALGLLLGERTKNDYIRDEDKKAVIEAVFDLQSSHETQVFLTQQGLCDADYQDLVISREFFPNGRSAARINGRNVNLHVLKALGTLLVDTQMQNDRYAFLQSSNYLGYVDGFSPPPDELLDTVAALFTRIKEAERQLADFETGQQMKNQKLDFLNYQIKEIEACDLKEGEEEELTDLRERIRNAQRLMEASHSMLTCLYSSEQTASAYDQISSALNIALNTSEDRFFQNLTEPLENIIYTLEDMARQISSYKDNLDFEPGLLDKVEERLYVIDKLKNKYGSTIHEILVFLDNARHEREELLHSEERQEEIRAELTKAQEQYRESAARLTALRQNSAVRLEERIRQELIGLNMPHTRFKVEIREKTQPGPRGLDEVEFLFSPNPGEELRPVTRIASGGEISRLILALKIALAAVYKVPTLIFDEIDAGLGGTSLSAMAQKIALLSTEHQVILVTHSPQLASYAQQHLLIDKYVENERSYTCIQALDHEARVKELARMLDGENYSELTLKHARELLESKT